MKSHSFRSKIHPLALAVFTACAGTSLSWGADKSSSTAITIYSSAQPGAISPEYYRPVPGQGVPDASSVPGYALVRDEREIQIDRGRSQLSFTDVAALIDPTTVTFTSLSEPSTRVLEQNFQFDLVSTQKLLLKFIDREITVDKTAGNTVTPITGTLLSALDGIVLRGKDGSIYSLPAYTSVRFPDLPGGLNTRPTLVWDVYSNTGGKQKTRVTYQTGGITWWADYNLIFNEGADANSGLLDLSAWVSIINQSGATYANSKLKLIDPEVRFLIKQDIPSITAQVELPGTGLINFYGVHPEPPGSQKPDGGLRGTGPRDAELVVVAKEVHARGGPAIATDLSPCI
jgi:hypothetical protein